MEYLPVYAIFSFLVLTIKIWVGWINKQHIRHSNQWFWLFFAGLLLINLLEFIGFSYPSKGAYALLLLTIYYMGLILMVASLLAMTLEVAGHLNRIATTCVYTVLVVGIISLAIPGFILDGVRSVGYTSTRIPGSYYWLFQILFLGSLVSSSFFLLKAILKPVTVLSQRKAKALLIATAPIIVAGLAVVSLMQMGIEITGSIIGSFVTLIFLCVIIVSENEHKLFTFLTYIPSTAEYKMAAKVRAMLSGVYVGNLNTAISEFEQLIINDALSKSHGNKSDAAEKLGISRSTLRRKMSCH